MTTTQQFVTTPKSIAIVPTQSAAPTSKPDLQARWVGRQDLETLKSAWEHLAENAIECNPAFESNVLIPALNHLASDAVRVLVVENKNAINGQEIVGLVPIETKRVYRLPFKAAEIWKHDQCFNSTPLLAKYHAAESWSLICEQLASDGYSLLSLDTVSAGPEIESAFQSLEGQRVRRFQRDHFQRAAFIPDFNTTTDDYVMKNASKNLRKNLGRCLRKLEEIGEVSWERSNEYSDFSQITEDFLQLESSGWKGREGTALACSKSTLAFYQDLISESAQQKKARFLSLKVEGQVVAMICDIQSGSTIYCYKTAYDESFAKFSVGTLVKFKNIENLFQNGVRIGDSCTSPGQSNMSRIWGQKLNFQNVIFSLKPGLTQLAVRLLPAIQTIRDTCKKSRN